jgi:hypothetical protein
VVNKRGIQIPSKKKERKRGIQINVWYYKETQLASKLFYGKKIHISNLKKPNFSNKLNK